MENKRLIIVISLFFLTVFGGIAFYIFVVAAPSVPETGPLPTASDNSSPFGRYSSDFKVPSASSTQTAQLAILDNATEIPSFQSNSLLQAVSIGAAGPVPTTGAVSLSLGTSTEILRFMEQGTGNVYDVDLSTGSSTRFVNTTIPKILDTTWTKDGLRAYMRFYGNDGITTELLDLSKLSSTSTENDVSPKELPKGILGFAFNGKKALFLGSDGSQSFLSENDFSASGKGVVVWRSPGTEWNFSWPTATTIVLATKPSLISDGQAYIGNIPNETKTLALDHIKALSVLPNSDVSSILYSGYDASEINTFILSLKTGNSTTIGLRTLAEKCVWSLKHKNIVYCGVPQNLQARSLPDSWYLGAQSLKDGIWKIDSSTGKIESLFASGTSTASIDITKPMLSAKEDYLLFTEKASGVEYALKLY